MKYAFLLKQMQYWQKQKESAIPDSSYYYYCFGLEMGYKLAFNELNKK